MRSVVRSFMVWLKLLLLSTCTVLLVTLRYILKTPQPLESVLPGESRLYKWVYGHIFYQCIGASDAPPLVLIHAPGIGASSYEMCSLMQTLAQRYRVYALDLLGFGLSDRPDREYSAKTYVRLCHDFLSEVVGRPATVLASGLSYQYCVAVAAEHPGLCERCIFLLPATLFENYRVPSWLRRIMRNTVLCTALYALITRHPILRSVIAWQSGREYSNISDATLNYYYASAHQYGAQYAAIAFLSGDLASKEYALQTLSLAQPTLLIASQHMVSRQLLSLEELQTRLPQVQIVQLQNQGELVVRHIMAWGNTLETKVPVGSVAQEGIEHEVIESPVEVPPPFIPSKISSNSTDGDNNQILVRRDESVASQQLAEEEPITSPSVEKDKRMKDTTNVVEAVEAYCVKCRKKRKIQQPKKIVTKKGRSAIEGTCSICGTKLFRFVAGQA